MIMSFKCTHCGNNDKDKAKEYDGLLGYEAVICDCCGWTFDHNGAHPPEAADLAKRVDWQKCQALICYAPNMYAFLEDLEKYHGNQSEGFSFIRGWMKGFKSKVNREGAELQKELARYQARKVNPQKTIPEDPENKRLEKF